ncbi:hypothetical protein D9613_007181 [Agrocybe pediades]|uniref:HSF-type DNA-binding domain-containing protein n=1 Tax=Agrocybe pediades TaxID=84607 RepID=A0A8H4QH35_9AGAR|nr:hypothetical protein D9613_007181 [Agrocybe pediades]
MDSYSDYSQRHQHQHQQQQWPPHHMLHAQSLFPSPPASEHGQHYPQFFQTQAQVQAQQQQQHHQRQQQQDSADNSHRATSSLSLNLSGLTVASPTNLSPINPPSTAAAAAALSPATPISPSTNPFGHHHLHGAPVHSHHSAHSMTHPHMQQQSQFSYDPTQVPPAQQSPAQQHQHPHQHQQPQYDDQGPPPGSSAGYDTRRTPAPSRSSSSGNSPGSQLPRKRSPSTSNVVIPGPGTNNGSGSLSINVNVNNSTLAEESMYEDESRDAAMELVSASSYDDLEVRTAYGGSMSAGAGGGPGSGGAGSPVDGSGSTSGAEDAFGVMGGVGGTMNILGKPLATNNFVTKLYQMINDPKSAQFISWTELGTSFVVSNVGEFSRSILGSHFKHNNFSSFVRQLNMYGFHKINRTPRAQRTSTDAQTWEFSHSKFLRGRQDLLDEIKRKALEPDPSVKHRVELPGEVAAQLNAMREDNLRMWDQLTAERRRVDKLVNVVNRLWQVVGKSFPGIEPPLPNPKDLLDSTDSPDIFVTSPTATSTSRFPPPLAMPTLQELRSMGMSANSSPTASDLPPSHMHHGHPHHPSHSHSHSLSRQQSFQHVNGYRGDSSSSTPLQSSPGSISMELFDDGSGDPGPVSGRKRQRLDENGVGVPSGMSSNDSLSMMSSVSSPGSGTGHGLANLTVPKKSSRARSDSAPLGYGASVWQQGGMSSNGANGHGVMGRPRSGSNLVPRGVPNIGNMTRANNASTPMLAVSAVDSDLTRR